MFVQIIALGPKMALIRVSIVLHRLIKGNVKNLQMSDSGPLWPSCHDYLTSADFFLKFNVFQRNIAGISSVANILNLDQAWHFVGHDKGRSSLQL